MATRNLYHVEDVGAALLYAIQTNHSAMAAQTSQELLDSKEDGLLHRLLTLAWILSDPAHPQQGERLRAVVASDSCALRKSLLGSSFDLPPLPDLAVWEPPPDRAEELPPPATWRLRPRGWTEAQAGLFWKVIQKRLRDKALESATELIAPLLTGNTRAAGSLLLALDVPASLVDLLETCVFAPLSIRILQHALASRIVRPAPASAPVPAPAPVVKRCHASRGFPLPIDALSCWRRPLRPLSQLLQNPVWISEEEATQYWKQACETYRVRRQGDELVSDDEEAFYSTCFPSDIPDEWSDEERAKSHGLLAPLASNPWIPAFLLCWS